MSRSFFFSLLLFGPLHLQAQVGNAETEFEGAVTYKVELKSKIDGVSDKAIKAMLASGDNMIAYIKKGNYRQAANTHDLYYVNSLQRAYLKFKRYDTLLFLEYGADSSKIINVTKQKDVKTIAGYTCSSVIIQAINSTKKYYYSPELHQNPDYDINNTLGNFNVYIKETQAVWLEASEETPEYILTITAVKVERKKIDDYILELPKLPEKPLTFDNLVKPAIFKRAGGFAKFLAESIDKDLASRYIKIPKGENEATQTAVVSFLVTERGTVTDVKVKNKNEVHPKLAEEALRVISSSPSWTPADVFGERTIYRFIQPVTFSVSRK